MIAKEQFLAKVKRREVRLAIVGLGYVGLPLAVSFAEAGFRVAGIDTDPDKVQRIKIGESYVEDIDSERLAPLVAGGLIEATTDFGILDSCDAVSICVPTPLGKTRSPDISYVVRAADSVVEHLRPGMLVVLESTTFPGTTTEILLPRCLQAGDGMAVGKDFFLCFSPERVDPGRKDWTTTNTPKVMGGMTSACLEVGTALYGSVIHPMVSVSSPEAAEMTKLLENTFRAVNIGLANEVLLICDKLGIDAWEVIEAADTKPFGFMKFVPGPGLGGHCIPVDPQYLSWKMRTLGYTARFIELATDINQSMPSYWTRAVQDALNEAGKPLRGSTILVVGVAYKRNVGDLREAPALDIMALLKAKGAAIIYHDSYVPAFSHEELELESVDDLWLSVREADCVLIATDHDGYDWERIHREGRLVVDTRATLVSPALRPLPP